MSLYIVLLSWFSVIHSCSSGMTGNFLLNARHYVRKIVEITWASVALSSSRERGFIFASERLVGLSRALKSNQSEIKLIKSRPSIFFKNWSISSSLPPKYNPSETSRYLSEHLFFGGPWPPSFSPLPPNLIKKHLKALLNLFVCGMSGSPFFTSSSFCCINGSLVP